MSHGYAKLYGLVFLHIYIFIYYYLPDVVISEILYADDLVLMSETIKGLMNNFIE